MHYFSDYQNISIAFQIKKKRNRIEAKDKFDFMDAVNKARYEDEDHKAEETNLDIWEEYD